MSPPMTGTLCLGMSQTKDDSYLYKTVMFILLLAWMGL